MTAPPTSFIVCRAASRGDRPRLSFARCLDDHDGVVHHDTDGKHEPEERDRIEGKPKHRHRGKRADERDRHGGERDDRRAPTLEEKEHDQRNRKDRLEQRVPTARIDSCTKTVVS